MFAKRLQRHTGVLACVGVVGTRTDDIAFCTLHCSRDFMQTITRDVCDTLLARSGANLGQLAAVNELVTQCKRPCEAQHTALCFTTSGSWIARPPDTSQQPAQPALIMKRASTRMLHYA